MIIFSLNTDGGLIYSNEWLTNFTGETLDSLNGGKWKAVIHEEDYESFSLLLKNPGTKRNTPVMQARLRHKHGGAYLWHQISLSPLKGDNDQLQNWIGYIVDINAQKVFEETLKDNAEIIVSNFKSDSNKEASVPKYFLVVIASKGFSIISIRFSAKSAKYLKGISSFHSFFSATKSFIK